MFGASMATDEVKRLTVDMSAEEHRQLKISAIGAGVTVRELVLRALRREGVIGVQQREGAFATDP
jgi:hypothetical protein